VENSEKENLREVLSAIRNMVRDETRAKFPETAKPKPDLKKAAPSKPKKADVKQNLPAKVLILHPHMRVTPKVIILDAAARISPEKPATSREGVAIANLSIDEGILRDIVREVVREQLRGELGREIIGAVKQDVALLLEKSR
jgi:hypothetical protein